MTFTYDLNTGGVLIIRASEAERETIAADLGDRRDSNAEAEVLESMICNSSLEWIDPNETGDLTEAPMLGFRADDGKVSARWAFMDYQVRSFLDDLIETGRAVFTS